jgi:hypothetical protein
VTTGYGSGGATDSNVNFVLSGVDAPTEVREMICYEEKHIKPFRNGATDSFIMTTKKCVVLHFSLALYCTDHLANCGCCGCGMTTVERARSKAGIAIV